MLYHKFSYKLYDKFTFKTHIFNRESSLDPLKIKMSTLAIRQSLSLRSASKLVRIGLSEHCECEVLRVYISLGALRADLSIRRAS